MSESEIKTKDESDIFIKGKRKIGIILEKASRLERTTQKTEKSLQLLVCKNGGFINLYIDGVYAGDIMLYIKENGEAVLNVFAPKGDNPDNSEPKRYQIELHPYANGRKEFDDLTKDKSLIYDLSPKGKITVTET